jgi:uncharacterized membrane protein YdjX (TVP38/TMEM64 family)
MMASVARGATMGLAVSAGAPATRGGASMRLARAEVNGVASESLVSLRSVKRRRDVRRVRAVNAEIDEKELVTFVASVEPTTELETESGAVALEANQSNVLAEPKEENNNLGSVAALVFLVGLAVAGIVYREDLFALMSSFTEYVDSLGPLGYALFMAGYIILEILAVPAFPLTMSAGALFGTLPGTLLVTTSATIAASVSFLISRYIARDKVQALAENYPKFKAIDKAIGKDSLRVVAIMRLSPLMPFALSNYLYGLTSVTFTPYVIGSFFGMMPGTFAYVSAGNATRQVAEGVFGGGAIFSTLFGFGLAVFSAGYVGKLATKAVEEETGLSMDEGDEHAS